MGDISAAARSFITSIEKEVFAEENLRTFPLVWHIFSLLYCCTIQTVEKSGKRKIALKIGWGRRELERPISREF